MNRYEKEFIEMHDFFRAWFWGEVEKTEAEFSRMSNVCAEGFTLVTAAGKILNRDMVLESYFDQHGMHPKYNYWIEHGTVRQQFGDITICTFKVEEGEKRTREHVMITTATYAEHEFAPNGVVFLYVQDTLIAM